MANISWVVDIHVNGSSLMSATTSALDIEAVDQVEVTIDPGDIDKVVEIQPGDALDVKLIAIKSSRYGDAFSYKISDGVTDSASITLDAPQLFTSGSLAIFGMAPQQLKFSSSAEPEQTTKVEIFVARDATPTPP